MAPQLSEDEIDDLLYAARVGDKDELTSLLSSLAEREKVTPADILMSAKDEGKSTCLHMAAGNGHAGKLSFRLQFLLISSSIDHLSTSSMLRPTMITLSYEHRSYPNSIHV